jgi:hypothetical protein
VVRRWYRTPARCADERLPVAPQLARLQTQVAALSAGKREAEERARSHAGELGALRLAMTDKEKQVGRGMKVLRQGEEGE